MDNQLITIGPAKDFIAKIYGIIFFSFIGLIVALTSSNAIINLFTDFENFNSTIASNLLGSIIFIPIVIISIYLIFKGIKFLIQSNAIYYDSNGIYTEKLRIDFQDIKYFKIFRNQWAVIHIYYGNADNQKYICGTLGIYCDNRQIEKIRNIFIENGVKDSSTNLFRSVLGIIIKSHNNRL